MSEDDDEDEKDEDEKDEAEKKSSQRGSDDESPTKELGSSEEESTESEESETEQQANEREYNDMAPTEPEVITARRMRKLAPSKMIDGAKCLFINFTFENDYNHILAKFISLFALMPSSLQLLIISLEPDATKVNTEFAEHFQRLM